VLCWLAPKNYRAAAVLLAGVACDVLYVGLTRWLLRWCERSTTVLACTVLFTTSAALGISLFAGPMFYVTSSPQDHFRVLAAIIASSNVFDFALSLFLVSVAIGLLMHRVFWPMATRALYALAPTRVQRGVLITSGSLLIAAAFGTAAPGALGHVLKIR
jgi:hypothetical protein